MITSISPIRDASLGGGFKYVENVVQKILPAYKCGRFYHRYHEPRQYVILPSMLMYMRSFLRRLFHKHDQSDQWLYRGISLNHNKFPRVTWIGHATFLIQFGSINILTDPIFGDATFLFRRIVAPRLSLEGLPPIDYVLISHNHRDHMDSSTLINIKRMYPEVKILVPYGDKYWFTYRGIEHVSEYFWWDQYDDQGIKFTFLPARHWSGRGWHDRNKSLWGSWMIEYLGKTIYFAGDTAYWKHFSCIRHYFNSIDVALMPIGPSEPFAYMRKSHLNADLAVKAFMDLGARHFVPMHWGTFYFGTDQFSTSIDRLHQAWKQHTLRLKYKMLHILKFGEPLHLVSRPTKVQF